MGVKPKKKTVRRDRKTIQKRIRELENQVASLKQIVRPIELETTAQVEAKNKLIISCDAAFRDDKSTRGAIVMRAPKPAEKISLPYECGAANCNEAELTAIYTGISSLLNLHMHLLNNSKIESIEVRSDSKTCIDWINKSSYPKDYQNKIEAITDCSKALTALTALEVKFVWRRRNSTSDLLAAHNLTQQS